MSQGPGWWQASDLKWYPPELHADYVAPLPPPPKLPPPPPPRDDVAEASRQLAPKLPLPPVTPTQSSLATGVRLANAKSGSL